ncbi:MAG: PBP1A family penicillin-binding protein [Tissierellia bacterium]|nr:PBP1A family penicillin-binding protein [Tissierellia bacterium]
MSNNRKRSKTNSAAFSILKIIKVLLIILLIAIIIAGIIIGSMVLGVVKNAPEIDPTTIIPSLSQTSTIYANDGQLIEKIQTTEFRTVVPYDRIPKYLEDAFISIEDERFRQHNGVDIIGIGSSTIENIKHGRIVRGASTITQQLVGNMYLDRTEKTLDRKLIEAYLAMQMEQKLSKEQIMEAYLNRINLGQGAYGVQEASQTYFSKNVEELTLAEAALFAGIVKSPTNYQPIKRIEPSDYDPDTMDKVGEIDVLGKNMYLIYNQNSVDRQHIVLKQMLKLGFIDQSQYDEALNEDIRLAIKPGQKVLHSMTSYPMDFVKREATQALSEHFNVSYEEAGILLNTGGFKIYSTIDLKMQKKLENIYENFTELIAGSPDNFKEPFLINWSMSKTGNIIDSAGRIVYYKYGNLFDQNALVLPQSSYDVTNDGLLLKTQIFRAYEDTISLDPCYTINAEKNLVVHDVGPIVVPKDLYKVNEEGHILISNKFLKQKENFYSIDENGILRIPEQFVPIQKDGIVQPQSATVIMDYHKGEIVALVGGRDVSGNRILNRATASPRQPGSSIKPLSVYLTAVANGKGAGSIVDDVPITVGGQAWPRNVDKRYHGLVTYRDAMIYSHNASAVSIVKEIGIKNSLDMLEKLGIIDKENPEKDSIITSVENRETNDENYSALALGGMTRGITPLEMTAAYGAIANDGNYIKPKSFTKILDVNDNLIVENKTHMTKAASPAEAYVVKDMMTSVVNKGYYGKYAKIDNMITAGKTGTTQERADIWFIGFTPYYAIGTWIGNDSPKINISQGSDTAAKFWRMIGESIHEGLEPIEEFERPDGVVEVKVCKQSGKLPSSSCSTITELFPESSVPTERCDQHKYLQVCSISGKIASKWCPSSLVESRSYFVREPAYKAEDHGGVYPPDYSSQPPSSYCDVHTEDAYYDFFYGPNRGSSNSSDKDND